MTAPQPPFMHDGYKCLETAATRRRRQPPRLIWGVITFACIAAAFAGVAISISRSFQATPAPGQEVTPPSVPWPTTTQPPTTTPHPNWDISVTGIGGPDVIGARHAFIAFTNHTMQRCNYFVTLALESADHRLVYDTSAEFATAIDPGQSAHKEVVFVHGTSNDNAVVVIKSVQRTAA